MISRGVASRVTNTQAAVGGIAQSWQLSPASFLPLVSSPGTRWLEEEIHVKRLGAPFFLAESMN